MANGPNTALLLPMKVQGQVIGVLQVTRLGTARFSPSQVTVSAILANHAAVAMDAGNLYHEVLHASRTDALTGLANARAFREALEQAVVHKESFSLLMLAADCLKRVNDTLGHLAGDRLLQGLAKLIERNADGVAGYPMDGHDAESLMRAADQAVYHAKQAGKNQVCLAG